MSPGFNGSSPFVFSGKEIHTAHFQDLLIFSIVSKYLFIEDFEILAHLPKIS